MPLAILARVEFSRISLCLCFVCLWAFFLSVFCLFMFVSWCLDPGLLIVHFVCLFVSFLFFLLCMFMEMGLFATVAFVYFLNFRVFFFFLFVVFLSPR